PLAAAVCAVAVGAMPRLWTLAVEAEVFTLHLALVLAFWIALVRWRAAPPARRGRWLLLAGLLAGLGLANHRTFLFVAAGGALTVLLSPARWPTPRQVLLTGALVLAGLTPYLYVVRGLLLPVAYFAPTDVRRLTRGEVWYVLQGNASGETAGGAIVAALLRDVPLLLDRSRWLGGHVAGQFGLLGALVAGLGAAGLLLVWRRHPAWASGAILGALGGALFGMAYAKYPDGDRYLLPLHTLLALGLGTLVAAGLTVADGALRGAARSAGARSTRGGRWAGVAGGLAGVVMALYFAIPLGVLTARTTATRGGYVHHTLHNLDGVAPDAVVCSWWSSSWGWWYAQYVDGHRPDVSLVPKGPDECDRDVVPQQLGRRPVYLPGMTDRVRAGAHAYFPSRDLWLAVGPQVTLREGALLKGPDEKIYLLQDGQRRWVPTLEVFQSRGFSWDGVQLAPPYALQGVPEGPPLAP
ncbi:MAG TPA: DUF2723 domain-containing protein, partial [Chloroflexota bacterium]|nr:DUF2723 domain-containing protein [Chloroflexota bacterium]